MRAINGIRGFRQENKGVTMVELLVVITILCFAVGIAGWSISLVYSRNPEKCARMIDEALEEARRSGMTMKGTFILKLDLTNGRMQTVSSEQGLLELKFLPAEIAVTLEAVGGTVDISSDTSLEVEFDKANGKVKSIKSDGRVVDGTMLSIRCESGSRQVTVTLVRATGKHFLEY